MTFLAALALGFSYTPPVQVSMAKVVPGLHPIAYAAAPTGSRVVASLEDGSVRIVDVATGATVKNLAKHPQAAYAVDWSKDGRVVVTGDETGRVWIENVLSGEKMREFRTHTRGVEWLSINLPRTHVITTGRDDQIHVLEIMGTSKKEKLAILGKGANFYGAVFQPNSLTTFSTAVLATGGGREYDASTGKPIGLMTGHDGQGALAVAYNPAGTLVASAGKDGNVAIFEAKTLKKLGTLKGHQDWVVNLAFSPDGRVLASSSTDRSVKIWDVKAMTKIGELPGQSAVGSPLCFTADSKSLLTVSDMGYMQINKVVTLVPAPVVAPPAKKAPVKVKKKTHRRRKG